MSTKKKKNALAAMSMKNRASLADDIARSNLPHEESALQSRKRKLNDKDTQVEKYVDSKLSKKILLVAQQQLAEGQSEQQPPPRPSSRPKLPAKKPSSQSDSSEDEDDDGEEEDAAAAAAAAAAPEDSEAAELSRHLYSDEPGDGGGGPLGQLDAERLRALIDDKRTEVDAELGGSDAGASSRASSCVPEAVRQHFESCRAVLRQYRSGKLPKPVKQLPHFAQWQELVELLEPGAWTAAAMCAVTKYFASKGKAPALQFYQGYLLPRCRDDISEYRRLNFHLYSALRKALFRQREFFCGLLLPWARDAISLPEATILGGLLRRVSIPVKFAAPALHMLLQLPYSGGRAILVRVLLEKKYNLPDPVLGQALAYFVAMETDFADHLNEDGRLPVLWHQALLALVERYGAYLSPEERQRLLKLCRQHQHPEITPAVRHALGQLQQQQQQRMDTGDD